MNGTFFERLLLLANSLMMPLVRMGLPMGARRTPMALLTVAGRNSGLPRTAPIALASDGEGWTVISVYGVSDWSRNLEAAGVASITMRGKNTEVDAKRLPPRVAAPVLREAMAEAPWMVRKMTAKYYEATTESPIGVWEQEAVSHPVFKLTPVQSA